MRLFLLVSVAALAFAPAAFGQQFPSTTTTTTTVEEGADYRMEVTDEFESGTLQIGCRKVTVGYTKTNGAFNDLYKIFHRQGWCWNSNTRKVTSLYGHQKWKECCDPGWHWLGWEPTFTTGVVGSNYTMTRRIEGHTKFCIPLFGCPDHDYPFIRLFMNANGSYGVEKGS